MRGEQAGSYHYRLRHIYNYTTKIEGVIVMTFEDFSSTKSTPVNNSTPLADNSIEHQIRAAMLDEGNIDYQDPIHIDGEIHRFSTQYGKSSNKSGWYVFFSDDPIAGAYGDWSVGITHKFCTKLLKTLSPIERDAFNARMKQALAKRDADKKASSMKAKQNANSIWSSSQPTVHHGYLQNKGIPSHGLRQNKTEQLIVPMQDTSGEIHSLQFINKDGTKYFLSGGATKGHSYPIGEVTETICICEGYSTAASVFATTGYYSIVAFNANNLEVVAKIIRDKYPSSDIIICGDNDQFKSSNVGKKSACKAAKAINARLVLPQFKSLESKPTDFNDLHRLEGGTVVKRQIGDSSIAESSPQLSEALLDYKALLSADIPERKKILPWLPEGGLAMVCAPRGLGKTFFALSLAHSITSGKQFMRWPISHSTGVLYIDGEMALTDTRKRLIGFIDTPPDHPLITLSHEYFYQKFERDLSITDDDVQRLLLKLLDNDKKLGVIIIDNLSSLTRIREDKSDDWRERVLPFLIACRRRAVAVVLIHHAGKNGDQRGTGAREDHLDTSIMLSKPDDHDNEGCYFRLDFTKSRGCYGDDIDPLKAKLIEPEGQAMEWQVLTIHESTKHQLINLIKDSGEITVTDAAKEMCLSKGMVSRLKKQLEEEGIIKFSTGKTPMSLSDLYVNKK